MPVLAYVLRVACDSPGGWPWPRCLVTFLYHQSPPGLGHSMPPPLDKRLRAELGRSEPRLLASYPFAYFTPDQLFCTFYLVLFFDFFLQTAQAQLTDI